MSSIKKRNDKLYNIKQNRFFAAVLICESVATDLDMRIEELAFIRSAISGYSTLQATRFGDWVDTFEPGVLAVAHIKKLLPALLVKIHTYGMDLNNFGKQIGNTIPFPFMDEITSLKNMGEEIGYDLNIYKKIVI